LAGRKDFFFVKKKQRLLISDFWQIIAKPKEGKFFGSFL
jgi:hypothetical protein